MHCVYEFPVESPDHVGCSNTEDLVHGGSVTKHFCHQICPYRQAVAVKGLGDRIERGLSAIGITKERVSAVLGINCGCPRRQAALNDRGYVVDGICCVVTSAPRPAPTVAITVESIWRLGLNPLIFAEPGTTGIPNGYYVMNNEVTLGCWHNWLRSARWALENTEAEFVLTAQDDTRFHPQTLEFIQSIEFPPDAGFLSLYTPPHYSRGKAPGVHYVQTKSLWGACALLWRRDALKAVLSHKKAANWIGAPLRKSKTESRQEWKRRSAETMQRRRENPHLIANADTVIGQALNAIGKQMIFVVPSPVSHIARHSSIGHGSNNAEKNRNCSQCADPHRSLFDQVYQRTVEMNAGKPRVFMAVPDVKHWQDRSKTALFVRVLQEHGYDVATQFISRTSIPMIPECDVLINHAFCMSIKDVERVAVEQPNCQIVQMNHSPPGHFAFNPAYRVARFTESVHLARRYQNVIVGCQGASILDQLDPNIIHLPTPGFELPPRPNHVPQRRVFLSGRPDPVKNFPSQMFAAVHAGCEIHVCSEPDDSFGHIRNLFPDTKFVFHWWLEHEAYLQVLREQCDVLLHCSFDESFCYAASEAMQMGIPVLCTPAIPFADELTTCHPSDSYRMSDLICSIFNDYGRFSTRAIRLGSDAVVMAKMRYVGMIANLVKKANGVLSTVAT